MKKVVNILVVIMLLTSTVNSNMVKVLEGGQYLVQYSEKAYASILTIIVGSVALVDLQKKRDVFIKSSVPLAVYPQIESEVVSRTNTNTRTARECINRVMFFPEYSTFNTEWGSSPNDVKNKARHACIHNLVNPMSYLNAARTFYNTVKAKSDWKNKWDFDGNRYTIWRDRKQGVISKRGNFITYYNNPVAKCCRIAGGLPASKFRKALKWKV